MMSILASGGAVELHSYHIPLGVGATLAAIVLLCGGLEVKHMRDDHEISMREAWGWTGFYIFLALAFGVVVSVFVGGQAGSEYYAAWAVEKALSLDNLFVMSMVFASFKVPHELERRMLNYGIAGAIIFRLVFIVLGLEMMKRFTPIMLVFGGYLLYKAIEAMRSAAKGDEGHKDMKNTRTWRFLTKRVKIIDGFEGHKIRVIRDGVPQWTLFIPVILIIEMQDIVFAIDSVPAVLAVSPDRFIAFSSNLMAILGLRALFFVYQNVADRFWAISWGVALILGWIGVKMVLLPFGVHIPIVISLGILAVLLFGSIFVSLLVKNPHAKPGVEHAGLAEPVL